MMKMHNLTLNQLKTTKVYRFHLQTDKPLLKNRLLKKSQLLILGELNRKKCEIIILRTNNDCIYINQKLLRGL